MTLAEAGDIFAYWRDSPPAHLMAQTVARMLGWKPPAGALSAVSEVAALAPPGLAVATNGDLGMPAPELDIEALRARNRVRLAKRAE